jgi:hypothetical protein
LTAVGVVSGLLWIRAGKAAKGIATIMFAIGSFVGGKYLGKMLERY